MAKSKGPNFIDAEATKRQDVLPGSMMGPWLGGIAGWATGGIGPIVSGDVSVGFGFGSSLAGMGMDGSFYSGWGSIGLNPYGVPFGSFNNYWIMDRNPTVALASATADAPIWSAEITYEAKPGVPQEVVDFIREQMRPWERHFLQEGTRARSDGFHAEELIWAFDSVSSLTADGVSSSQQMLVLKKPKPLAPELTIAKVAPNGDIVGLQNQGDELNDPRRFLWLTHDGRGMYPYGRSRKENFKKPWLRQEQAYDELEASLNITVRPFGYITFPQGLKDGNGKPLDEQLKKNACAIGKGLAQGQFVQVPDPFAPYAEQMIEKGIDPSKVMPYKIGWYDTKTDHGGGFKIIFDITDRGIVCGTLQPPRSILEGPGTQADAETHSDTGVKINERSLGEICREVNRVVIDTLLVQNFGDKYRGAVWWQPSPLVDLQASFNNDLVKQTLGGQIGPFLLKRVIDLANIFEKSGVKTRDFDQDELVEDMEKEAAEQRKVQIDTAAAVAGAKSDPLKASLFVESTEPIAPEEKKRRKAFLLALLAFFGWQAAELVGNPDAKATDDVYTTRLAKLLADNMRVASVATLPAQDVHGALPAIDEEVKRVGSLTAKRLNETTEKNLQTGLVNGQTRTDAIDAILRKSVETRSSLIEDDLNHVSKQIGTTAGAAVAGKEVMWRTKDDERVCVDQPLKDGGIKYGCMPLHGVVVKAGQEFAPGVRYPVIDTHGNCRCEIVPVGHEEDS